MTRLVVEVSDLADASRGMYSDMADPLDVAIERLTNVLFDSAAMAGTDEAGTSWAEAYDDAARSTTRATTAAANGCYRLSAMFAQTGRNYAAADSASTPSDRRAVDSDIERLPSPTSVSFPPPPTARGGSVGAPTGWGLIQHAVGYVWPDGHQDRLLAAADAWSASAAVVASRGDYAAIPVIGAFVDGLPERDDMHTVCTAMGRHLHDLARAHRALAQACRDLAHHIDQMRSAVEHELLMLGAETAGIQVVGGILAFFTAGAAEAPTQGLQAERILAVAKTVKDLIQTYIAAAKTAFAELPAIKAMTANIQLLMDRLAASPLVNAAMAGAPSLPGAVGAAKLAKTSEVLATERMLAEGREAESLLAGVSNPRAFDPQSLRGLTSEEVKGGIPRDWERDPSVRGDGEVFRDPANKGRQIRVMDGYPAGSRPDSITTGPYVVVSQMGRPPVKIALAGNPTL